MILLYLLIILILWRIYSCLQIESFEKSSKLEIQKPNNFLLQEDRYLFCDIFISGDDIVAVSMIYPDITIKFDEIIINIPELDIETNFTNYNVHRLGASSVICILKNDELKEYLKNNNSIEINVNYLDKSENYLIHKNKDKNKYNLTMQTHFKNDYDVCNEWMKYYKNIGVDHFYLFYNGKIEGDVYNYFSNLKNKSWFTLIEWDYKFWLNDIGWEIKHLQKPLNRKYKYNMKHYESHDLKNNIHHAQILAINTSIYKYKNNTNWIGYFDLDEFILCNNLINLLSNFKVSETALVYFANSWANIDNINRLNFTIDKLKNKIIRDNNTTLNNYCNSWKNKNIINPKNIYNYQIHHIKNIKPNTKIVNSWHYFLHFFKFSPKNRIVNLIKNPIIEYGIKDNIMQNKLKSIIILKPAIHKSKKKNKNYIIYKFKINNIKYSAYFIYNNIKDDSLISYNIDRIISLLIPFAMKNNYKIYSNEYSSNYLHENKSSLVLKFRKLLNNYNHLIIDTKIDKKIDKKYKCSQYEVINIENDVQGNYDTVTIQNNKNKIIKCKTNLLKLLLPLYTKYNYLDIYNLFYNIWQFRN